MLGLQACITEPDDTSPLYAQVSDWSSELVLDVQSRPCSGQQHGHSTGQYSHISVMCGRLQRGIARNRAHICDGHKYGTLGRHVLQKELASLLTWPRMFELLGGSNPPLAASQVAKTIGMYHHTGLGYAPFYV
jgi:hypothetical protein